MICQSLHNKKEIRDKEDMTRGWNGCPVQDDGKKWTIFQKKIFPFCALKLFRGF